MVPIIDTLPSTQTNSAKEDGETAQENYSLSEMFQDLKNQRTIFEPDASRSGTRLKAIIKKKKKKHFSYPISRENLEKKREVFCFLGTINGPGYTTTKLKTVYISMSKKADHYNILNVIRVESLKQDILIGNKQEVLTNVFIKMNPQTVTNKAIQGLIETPKSRKVFLK